jgi:hypothetical protein
MGLLAKSKKRLPATMQLLHSTRNYDDRQIVRLEITDATSRMQVVEVEMDAEQFLNLMRGAQAHVTAAWSTALDRIGLEMQHGTETRPNAEYGNQMAADHHAQKWAEVNGWTTWEARRNNEGNWVFTGRRWVEPGTEQQ